VQRVSQEVEFCADLKNVYVELLRQEVFKVFSQKNAFLLKYLNPQKSVFL
jgi:hypothetical protein